MIKRLSKVDELVKIIMQCIICYLLASQIFCFTRIKTFILPLYMVLMCIICYLMRRYIRGYMSRYIVHFIVSIMFIIPVILVKLPSLPLFYYVVEYCFINIYSIYYVKHQSEGLYIKRPNIVCIIIIAIIFMYGSTSINYILACIFLTLYYLSFYIEKSHTYLSFYSTNRVFNFKSIMSISNVYLLIFYIGSFLAVALCKVFNIDGYLNNMISPFLEFIKYQAFVPREIQTTIQVADATSTPDDIGLTNFDLGSNEALQILVKTVMIIIEITVVFAVIVIICYAIYKLRISSIKYKKLNEDDEYESVEEHKDESIIKNIEVSDRDNNNKKLRKIYRKKILTIKKKIPGIRKMTPTEIDNQVKNNDYTDISKLTNLYQKARYSNKECTSKEVNEASKFLGKKK